MCAAAVIISRCWVDAHALVQLSVQQKYDFQNIEKYGVLGGKKYCRKTWDLLSSRAAAARWRGGDGCSLPATHQIGPSTISNISGNSWDLFINVLRVFWTFTLHWGRRSAPHLWGRLDRPHCSWMLKNFRFLHTTDATCYDAISIRIWFSCYMRFSFKYTCFFSRAGNAWDNQETFLGNPKSLTIPDLSECSTTC